MGTFKITNQTKNVQYTYVNGTLSVSGSIVKDCEKNTVKSVNGQVYRVNTSGQQGEYVGNFNGSANSGEMKYSIPSELTRKDAMSVWAVIDEIEPHINDTTDAE